MKRTIEIVFNKRTKSPIEANEFFKKPERDIWKFREQLQKVIQGIEQPILVCYACGQNIKINGGGESKKILHFAHQKDSEFCKLKTDNKFSLDEINRIKYNGAKESELHFNTKKLINHFLSNDDDFTNVKLEKVKKDTKDFLRWRKPDVSAIYKNLDLVFEIQLSTTFLSVIIGREQFYKSNQTFILWIFKKFDTDFEKQKFTDKDIFYTNNRNAFVLDKKAIQLSKAKNKLFLNCYYLRPVNEGNELKFNWNNKYVCVQELTFDELNYKVFYFDVEKEENIVKSNITHVKEKARKQRKEEERQSLLVDLMPLDDNTIDYSSKILEETDDKTENSIEESYQEKLYRNTNIFFEDENHEYISELKRKQKLTTYQRIFVSDFYFINDNLRNFFNSKILEKDDKKFIKKLFNKVLQTNEKIVSPKFEYYIIVSIFLSKISNKKELLKSYDYRVEKFLFAVLSIKYKKVIGFSLNNLIQIVNLYSNPGNKQYIYFHIIIKAISEYYGVENFLKKFDNKGKLRNKIDNDLWKKQKKDGYNEIIRQVFPEIGKSLA